MASQVIYSRVPQYLKDAADEYARQRGMKLSVCVSELLERGLTASSDEASANHLQDELEKLGTENVRLHADLQATRTELSAYSALATRASRTVGSCMECGAPITGSDLLANGKCPSCGHQLPDLLAASSSGTLDMNELLMLLGMVGIVLGAAILLTKK